MTPLEVLAVDGRHLDLLTGLFVSDRQTRHCWCMAFCAGPVPFAAGWYGGGNRRRLLRMASSDRHSVGVLAVAGGEAVGWCACGHRARYGAGAGARSRTVADRERRDPGPVWQIACLFVRPDQRGATVVPPLLRGAIAAAQRSGALAVEAWPLPSGVRDPAQAHLGREGVFARLGFDPIARPAPDCVVMRLDLAKPG